MSIGSDLKSARAAAGLTLEQVAAKTKLRTSLVAAIESNDFSLCGGDVYARGHLRVLANLYRIDSTYLLELFDQTFGVTETALDDLAETTSRNLDRRISISWKSLSGIAAVALLGAVVVSNQLPSNQESVLAPAKSSTASESNQELAAAAINNRENLAHRMTDAQINEVEMWFKLNEGSK